MGTQHSKAGNMSTPKTARKDTTGGTGVTDTRTRGPEVGSQSHQPQSKNKHKNKAVKMGTGGPSRQDTEIRPLPTPSKKATQSKTQTLSKSTTQSKDTVPYNNTAQSKDASQSNNKTPSNGTTQFVDTVLHNNTVQPEDATPTNKKRKASTAGKALFESSSEDDVGDDEKDLDFGHTSGWNEQARSATPVVMPSYQLNEPGTVPIAAPTTIDSSFRFPSAADIRADEVFTAVGVSSRLEEVGKVYKLLDSDDEDDDLRMKIYEDDPS